MPVGVDADGWVTFAKADDETGGIEPIAVLVPNDHGEVLVPMDASHLVCRYS